MVLFSGERFNEKDAMLHKMSVLPIFILSYALAVMPPCSAAISPRLVAQGATAVSLAVLVAKDLRALLSVGKQLGEELADGNLAPQKHFLRTKLPALEEAATTYLFPHVLEDKKTISRRDLKSLKSTLLATQKEAESGSELYKELTHKLALIDLLAKARSIRVSLSKLAGLFVGFYGAAMATILARELIPNPNWLGTVLGAPLAYPSAILQTKGHCDVSNRPFFWSASLGYLLGLISFIFPK